MATLVIWVMKTFLQYIVAFLVLVLFAVGISFAMTVGFWVVSKIGVVDIFSGILALFAFAILCKAVHEVKKLLFK